MTLVKFEFYATIITEEKKKRKVQKKKSERNRRKLKNLKTVLPYLGIFDYIYKQYSRIHPSANINTDDV